MKVESGQELGNAKDREASVTISANEGQPKHKSIEQPSEETGIRTDSVISVAFVAIAQEHFEHRVPFFLKDACNLSNAGQAGGDFATVRGHQFTSM